MYKDSRACNCQFVIVILCKYIYRLRPLGERDINYMMRGRKFSTISKHLTIITVTFCGVWKSCFVYGIYYISCMYEYLRMFIF